MIGRPGDGMMEMNGGSTALYLVRAPCVPVFLPMSRGQEANGLFRGDVDFQGRRGLPSFRCAVEPLPCHIWCRRLPVEAQRGL